jgi:hypothetical protein
VGKKAAPRWAQTCGGEPGVGHLLNQGQDVSQNLALRASGQAWGRQRKGQDSSIPHSPQSGKIRPTPVITTSKVSF